MPRKARVPGNGGGVETWLSAPLQQDLQGLVKRDARELLPQPPGAPALCVPRSPRTAKLAPDGVEIRSLDRDLGLAEDFDVGRGAHRERRPRLANVRSEVWRNCDSPGSPRSR